MRFPGVADWDFVATAAEDGDEKIYESFETAH